MNNNKPHPFDANRELGYDYKTVLHELEGTTHPTKENSFEFVQGELYAQLRRLKAIREELMKQLPGKKDTKITAERIARLEREIDAERVRLGITK